MKFLGCLLFILIIPLGAAADQKEADLVNDPNNHIGMEKDHSVMSNVADLYTGIGPYIPMPEVVKDDQTPFRGGEDAPSSGSQTPAGTNSSDVER